MTNPFIVIAGSYLMVAVTATHCAGPAAMPVRESCQVLKATLWHDGKFNFSDDEVAHMSDRNQTKIAAVKTYYWSNCLKK